LRIFNERHAKIVSLYQDEGKSTKEIADQFDITSRGVRYILGKYDVKLRGRRRINGYKVDEDFFKRWSNEMAYVLGFIYTDGSVNSNTLTISQNERYILERINEVMASNCVISESDNGKNTLYTLYIHRKEIVEDLRKLGVVEGKSRIMLFPEIPDEYLPHFIRGVIDGDGWVQDRGYTMNVTNASKTFSHSLHDVFKRQGLNTRITQQENAYRVWVSGKYDIIKLANWVYEECSDLYLRRKFDRFYVNKAS